jgi:hypothetical protein
MRKSDICPECRGECQVEYERWVPRSFQDDIGGFESYWSDCENCDGLARSMQMKKYYHLLVSQKTLWNKNVT